MTPTTGVHHIFVDFENVQKLDLSGFCHRVVKVALFLGAKQKRLDTTLVQQLVERAEHVHLVRLTSSGKNALDFALAHYLGRAICGDPTGFFHVVSKDQGFDPLIDHLRRQQTKVVRHDDFAAAIAQIVGPARGTKITEQTNAIATGLKPISKPAADPPENTVTVDEAWAHLKEKAAHRPKTRGKLCSLLKNHFHLSEPEIDRIISELSGRHIDIDTKDKVTYRL